MENIIDKILYEDINYEIYYVDYYAKCSNNNYQKYLDLENQLPMLDFISFIKLNKEQFLNEINNIKKEFLYVSITHGLNHNIRVLLSLAPCSNALFNKIFVR